MMHEETKYHTHIPSLKECTPKVDEIVILNSVSSATRMVSANTLCALRSSGSGRFLIMVSRRNARFSVIPRAVEEEMRNASGAYAMLRWRRQWKWLRIARRVKREHGGRAREVLVWARDTYANTYEDDY